MKLVATRCNRPLQLLKLPLSSQKRDRKSAPVLANNLEGCKMRLEKEHLRSI